MLKEVCVYWLILSPLQIPQSYDTVDLFDKIKQTKHGLNEQKAQMYLMQISHAARVLHDNNLAHLDLSVENVIIDKNDRIKLIDFGVCSEIVENGDQPSEVEEKKRDANLSYSKHIRSRLLPGKDGYRAPEIECRQICNPVLADAFSFGYLAWIVLCGNMPFQSAAANDETFEQFQKYGSKKWIEITLTSSNAWKDSDDFQHHICSNAIAMLDELLEPNVYKRKSIEDLLNDHCSFLHHKEDEKKCTHITNQSEVHRPIEHMDKLSDVDPKMIEF